MSRDAIIFFSPLGLLFAAQLFLTVWAEDLDCWYLYSHEASYAWSICEGYTECMGVAACVFKEGRWHPLKKQK